VDGAAEVAADRGVDPERFRVDEGGTTDTQDSLGAPTDI
jgi:hypothetical protein